MMFANFKNLQFLLLLLLFSCGDSQSQRSKGKVDNLNYSSRIEDLERSFDRLRTKQLKLQKFIGLSCPVVAWESVDFENDIKYILRLSDKFCDSCIDQEVDRLFGVSNSISSRTLIITSFQDSRLYDFYSKKYKRLNWSTEENDLLLFIDEQMNSPYYLKLNGSTITGTFIPRVGDDSSFLLLFMNSEEQALKEQNRL